MCHRVSFTFSLVFTAIMSSGIVGAQTAGFNSLETGLTICKVRSAANHGVPYIVASSYEGTVLGISYDGRVLWKNVLSGFMNRDLWCKDITGDGADEILAANADGTLYCLDHTGSVLWQFHTNDAPMNAVCVVRHSGTTYVVCGGYDLTLYYLTTDGQLAKTIESASYSREKPWGKPGEKRFPDKRAHIANFVRTVRGPDAKQWLAVHGIMNSNATTGSIYLFEPMADQPFHIIGDLPGSKPYGDLSICDINADGVDELLLGTSTMIQDSHVVWVDLQTGQQRALDLVDLRRQIDGFGYRVAQTVSTGNDEFLISVGSHLIVSPATFDVARMEFHTCGYSFNDLWKDPLTGRVLLGSAQSGGSCIHVINPNNPEWKPTFSDFQPTGKLKAILDNTAGGPRAATAVASCGSPAGSQACLHGDRITVRQDRSTGVGVGRKVWQPNLPGQQTHAHGRELGPQQRRERRVPKSSRPAQEVYAHPAAGARPDPAVVRGRPSWRGVLGRPRQRPVYVPYRHDAEVRGRCGRKRQDVGLHLPGIGAVRR
jgi:WD40 repeat protein